MQLPATYAHLHTRRQAIAHLRVGELRATAELSGRRPRHSEISLICFLSKDCTKATQTIDQRIVPAPLILDLHPYRAVMRWYIQARQHREPTGGNTALSKYFFGGSCSL